MYRVAIVSRGWYPLVKGGADKFIARLAEKLAELEFAVLGITRITDQSAEKVALSLSRRTKYELIFVKQTKQFPLISSIMFSIKAAKIVNRIKPGVVIVNGYWAEASPIFIKKDIPVIVVIHDVGLFRSEWARRHRVKHFLRVEILRRVVRRADRIVVPVEAVKKDLMEFLGVQPEKIVVLGGEGVDGPMKYEHVENNYFDIVQVGRFAPNKGQLMTLRAFEKVLERIPRARLWLVGGRPLDREHREYFEKIRHLADEINRWVGREAVKIVVDAEDVSQYYRIADICVSSSTGEEGYGLVVVECMAYGKPVIGTEIFKETGVLDGERGLIVPIGDHEKLVSAIIRLYRDKELYRKLSQAGLKYAKKNSWEKVANIFEGIINELLSRKT